MSTTVAAGKEDDKCRQSLSELCLKSPEPSTLPVHQPISPTSRNYLKEMPILVVGVKEDGIQALIDSGALVLDIRPFNLFSVSRIKTAVNACIPTTLLKRTSYSIHQILNSTNLPEDTKNVFLNHAHAREEGTKPFKVLIYDNDSSDSHISFPLFQTCSKFVLLNDESYTAFEVFYLDGGFSSICENSPVLEIPSEKEVNSNGLKSSSLSGFKLPLCTPAKQKFLNALKKNMLPRPEFGAQNEDEDTIINPPLESPGKNYIYSLRIPEGVQENVDLLPEWLRFFGENTKDPSYKRNVIRKLNKLFNKIEQSEQVRLKTAIANNCFHHHIPNVCTPSALCPACDDVKYQIPKGIEYGYKNRYNNIWPYEHSRVKLLVSPHARQKSDDYDDYFNANYIECSKVSKKRYIATQNPLSSTFEDFWKTVWYNDIEVIVCLNEQSGNKFSDKEKKYFDDQVFPDSSLQLNNTFFERHNSFDVRKIELTKNDKSKTVYHLQFKEWPDFGVPSSLNCILDLIHYKNNIVKILGLNKNILVHCLAGCGRTGTFITIDMVIDCFESRDSDQLDPWGPDDLVYKSVQYQRTQRISMVQNLDQFIYCYEVILKFAFSKFISGTNDS